MYNCVCLHCHEKLNKADNSRTMWRMIGQKHQHVFKKINVRTLILSHTIPFPLVLISCLWLKETAVGICEIISSNRKTFSCYFRKLFFAAPINMYTGVKSSYTGKYRILFTTYLVFSLKYLVTICFTK